MNTLRIFCLLVLFSLPVPGQMFSQRFSDRDRNQQDERVSDDQPHQLYFEYSNFISDSAGKGRLDVSFRIPQDFFVFVRNLSEQTTFPFTAHGDITVEVLDSANGSVGRELLAKELGANKPEQSISVPQFIQGVFSFDLKPGKYTVVTEVKDRESSHRYFDKEKKVQVKDFSGLLPEFSDIMFAESPKTWEDSLLVPYNFGGSVPFGRNFIVCVEFVTPHSPESTSVSYEMFLANNELHERTLVAGDTLRSQKFLSNTVLSLERNDKGYVYRLKKCTDGGRYLLMFHIAGDSLKQGNYELQLSLATGSGKASLTKAFRIRWMNMPRSLRNFELAVGALEYIMTESEFKEIRSGTSGKQRAQFEEFWKKKDPTPVTAYNEAMDEYYRRVDYAMMSFGTVKLINGMKTERGKAYILYGPPTRTEREMSPNEAPKEIWYYASLNKKLIFVDDSHNGEYKLVEIEKLQ